MTLRDAGNWKEDKYLVGSTPSRYVGCMKFLREKAQERASDLRLSQQASYMLADDARDIRDFFEFGLFRVDHLISDLTYLSYFGSVNQIIQGNCDYRNSEGKRDVRGQA